MREWYNRHFRARKGKLIPYCRFLFRFQGCGVPPVPDRDLHLELVGNHTGEKSEFGQVVSYGCEEGIRNGN